MAVQPPNEVNLEPNKLVTTLGKVGPEALLPDAAAAAVRQIAPATFRPSDSPERRSFVGVVGSSFEALGEPWCVLYLDWDLKTWLLIQARGILGREELQEPGTPPQDVLWVKGDAAVSSGSDALSLEGLFLMGNFTRAGDFDVEALTGGTQAAGTGGYGLAGQSPPRCCNRTIRRP